PTSSSGSRPMTSGWRLTGRRSWPRSRSVPAVDLGAGTATTYVRGAIAQMHDLVERLAGATRNPAPRPPPNTRAALGGAACAAGEFWLGQVGLGRASDRDRDSEFTATATRTELHAQLDAAADGIVADIGALDRGEASPANAGGRQFLQDGDETDASLVVHV